MPGFVAFDHFLCYKGLVTQFCFRVLPRDLYIMEVSELKAAITALEARVENIREWL